MKTWSVHTSLALLAFSLACSPVDEKEAELEADRFSIACSAWKERVEALPCFDEDEAINDFEVFSDCRKPQHCADDTEEYDLLVALVDCFTEQAQCSEDGSIPTPTSCYASPASCGIDPPNGESCSSYATRYCYE